jgi:hypothetical protein
MAEEHLANSGNIHTERLRPAVKQAPLLGIELMRGPAHLFRQGAVFPVQLGQNANLAVPIDEADGEIKRKKLAERFTPHWSRYNVASNHNPFNLIPLEFCQDRFQSWQVSMNVIKRCNRHRYS